MLEANDKQPLLETVGAFVATGHEYIVERSCDRLDEVLAFDVPAAAAKVRYVERELSNSFLNGRVVATRRYEIEFSNRLGVSKRACDSTAQLIIGPSSSSRGTGELLCTLPTEVRAIETKLFDVAIQFGKRVGTRSKAKAANHL
jgi:hypothetical protein